MSVFGSDCGGDWDLRAVVRGCNMSMDDVPHTCFSPLMSYHHLYEEQQEEVVMNVADDDHDLIFGNLVFPEYLFADLSCSSSSTTAAGAVTATNNHNNSSSDLLINPFYNMNNSFSFSPQSTSSDNNLLSDDQNPQPDHIVPAADDPCSKPVGAKYRRRKNQQHKRVVMEVAADGLCSDMWAWRKYGQKPIKGSPYPRSYYRCSSSRGCPARKQVERSTHHDHSVDLINTNNNNSNTTFIITYTAEHNHSKPTRRNSLAGTTRQRFSTPSSSSFKPTATAADHEQNMMIKKKMKKNIKIDNDISSLSRPVLLPKKTEMEAAGDHDHQVKEINIINHDHMMMMNDFDFDEDQLNAAASGDLQFHPNEVAHMTCTNFW